MKSKRTKQFRELLRKLPDDIKRQAYSAYRLFKYDPYHPSLHLKQVSHKKAVYSVRIGISYRALGLRKDDDVIVWFWIGSHAEYDKLLSR
jgi:mRNA-degrading endonuclease RelE of RelBE toxin-antitoxin system